MSAWLGVQLGQVPGFGEHELCSVRRAAGPCPGLADPPCRRVLQALEAVNTQLRELYPDSEELFDIVLMTNNHAQVGVRLINSINHYGELSAKHPSCRCCQIFGGVLWLGSGLRRCFLLSLPPNCVLSPLLPIFLGSEWKLALFGGWPGSPPCPPALRSVHREVLHDGREQPHLLPQGLPHQPLPLLRRRESEWGH